MQTAARGFWKCFDCVRLIGDRWNHEQLHRVYFALWLNLSQREKRRVATCRRQPLVPPTWFNGMWVLDFMHDALFKDRWFRTLDILNEGNREGSPLRSASRPSTFTRVQGRGVSRHS